MREIQFNNQLIAIFVCIINFACDQQKERGRERRRNLLAFISQSSNYENVFQQPSMKSCHLVLSDGKRERDVKGDGERGGWREGGRL